MSSSRRTAVAIFLGVYTLSLIAQSFGMPFPVFNVPTVYAAECNDALCEEGEDSLNCPEDCGSVCGDTVCNGTESTADCPDDCGTSCGDAVCNGSETTMDCPDDCGSSCGDMACNGGEDTTNCVDDCGSFCGDGTTNGPEECDSSGVDTPFCDSDCTLVACSDYYTNNSAGEECDDGGVDSGSCDSDCTLISCGDGHYNPHTETCDEDGDGPTCDSDCSSATCGDGYTNNVAGEDCDTGTESGSCDGDCTAVECGDGYANASAFETCDTGGESASCDDDCSNVSCGDGNVNESAGETCDDSGESASCDDDCTTVSCGDTKTNEAAGETCDTGGDSGDCDSDCTAVECGDGHINGSAGETCDDSGESATCDDDCTAVECGDSVVNEANGETCDHSGETSTCDSDCTAVECGDGQFNTTAGEQCDEGGEGATCDDDCSTVTCGDGNTNETAGETCDESGETATCDDDCSEPTCGDGNVNEAVGEDCDTIGGESISCDDDCTEVVCGDGNVNESSGETCDDSGESAMCDDDCTGVACGDGMVNTSAGEACDDDNTDNGDGCSDSCQIEDLVTSQANAGHTYVRHSGAVSRTDAQTECEELGGKLVSITSEEENDAVLAMLDGESIWIGLFDAVADTNEEFEWVSGEPFVYENWDDTEPNDGGDFLEDGAEDCVVMFSDGTWNDYDCAQSLAYICEYDTNLIGHWRFDEGSGTDKLDSTSFNHDGTDVNTPEYNTATPISGEDNDYSLTLSLGDGVHVPAFDLLPVGNAPRSVSLWLRADFGDFVNGGVFGYGDLIADNAFYLIILDNSLCLGQWGGGDAPCTSPMESNESYFVAVTFDGTEADLYLNGVLSGSATRTFNTSQTDVRMGNFADQEFAGDIDDVRLWNTALTAEEVEALAGDLIGPVIAEETPVPELTNNSTPSYSFTSDEEGTIVYGGACASEDTEASVGSNAITFNALTEGTYSECTIMVVDASGNESNTLTLNTFYVDLTVTTPSGLDLNASADSGVSDSDDITNVQDLVIDVACESDAEVELLNNVGDPIASGTCASSTFQFTLDDVADGTHNYSARQTDPAGNVSTESDGLSVTVDTTVADPGAPDLLSDDDSGTSNEDNLTTSSTLRIDVGCEEGNSVMLYQNEAFVGTETCGVGTVQFNLMGQTDGSYEFRATQEDIAGNLSVSSSILTVNVDQSISSPGAPDLIADDDTGSDNADNLTNKTTTVTIEIACEEYASVGLYEGESMLNSGTCGASGISLGITLAAGEHTLTARQTDLAGNTSDPSSSLTVTVDNAQSAPGTPDLNATYDSGTSDSDDLTNSTTLVFDVSCEDGATVELLSGLSVLTSGVCSSSTVQLSLLDQPAGSSSFVARQTDVAGNVSDDSESTTVTIDTTGPVVSEVNAVPTPTNDSTPSYSFSTDEGSGVSYGGSCVSATTLAGEGTNVIDFDGLSDGTYVDCTITLTDDAGNSSNVLSVSSFTVDTTVPILAEVTPVPTPTNDSTPDYTFSSNEDGTISYGGDCSSGTTSGSAGNITVTFDALSDGAHSNCWIVVTDDAGNASASLAVTSFSVDTEQSAPGTPDLNSTYDSGTSDSDDLTNSTTLVFDVSCEDGASVELIESGSPLTSATCSSSTVQLSIGPVSSGEHTYTARQTDVANNTSGVSSGLLVIVDTTEAAPGTPDLNTASDSGTSGTDDLTNETTYTLDVACTDGDLVEILEGLSIEASGECSGSSIGLSVSGGDGAHTYTARQTDDAGNTSDNSASLTIVVDTSEAAPGTPDLIADDDTGTSSTDDVTNAMPLAFDVSCSNDNTVELVEGGIAVASGTCASGTVQLSVSGMAEGSHTYGARQTDQAGNISGESSGLTIVLDTTISAPGTPDLNPLTDSNDTGDDVTNYTSLQFNISCEDGTTVELLSSLTVTLSEGTCSAGDVNLTTTVESGGSYTYKARQTDSAGNLSGESGTITVTVDVSESAPGVPDLQAGSDSGSANDDNITSQSSPIFTIACSSGALVELLVGGSSQASGTCSSSTIDLTADGLAEGAYAITARQTDVAGNLSPESNSLAVTIDQAAPGLGEVIPVATPTSDSTPTYVFSSNEEGVITYDGGCESMTTEAVVGNTTITFDALADDTYAGCTITVTDVAGNVASLVASSFTVDTTAPELAEVTPVPTPAEDTTPSYTFSTSENGTITYGGSCDSVTTEAEEGNVTVTFNELSIGEYTDCTITVTDAAGNASEPLQVNSFVIQMPGAEGSGTPDLISDSDTGASDTDNVTSDNTPSFDIVCNEEDEVQLRQGSVTLDSGFCTTDHVIRLTASELDDGVYNVTSRADDGGGFGDDSDALSVTIDTSAPSATGTPDMTAGTDTGASSTDNVTSDATPTFAVSCAGTNTVTLKSDSVEIGTGTCSSSSVAITASIIADGDHTITATQTDLAGNESTASTGLAITIDTSASSAPGTPDMTSGTDTGSSSTDNVTSDATPTFTVSCTGTDTVTLKNGSTSIGTGTCSSSTVTITAATIANGDHTITATQTDLAGNESTVSSGLAVTIDTSTPAAPGAPDVTAASDTGSSILDNITTDTTPTVTINCGGTSAVTLKSDGNSVGTGTCSSSTVTITASTLTEGVHSLTATQTDLAGNESIASSALSLTVDTTADDAPGTPDLFGDSDRGESETDNVTLDATPTFTIACVSDSAVTLKADGTIVGVGVCASSTVTITASTLTEAVYAITATQTDVAGNVSPASSALSITIDTTAPADTGAPDLKATSDTGTSSTDNITTDLTPTFDVTCTDDLTVELVADGISVATETCVDGAVEITPQSALDEGEIVISALQIDLAGNESDLATLEITIDATAPTYDSGSYSGTTVTLVFDEDLSDTVPGTGSFLVMEGDTAIAVTEVATDGETVTLTLASAPSDSLLFVYTSPEENGLQDVAGNEVSSFDDVTLDEGVTDDEESESSSSTSSASSSAETGDSGGGGGGGGGRRSGGAGGVSPVIRGGVYSGGSSASSSVNDVYIPYVPEDAMEVTLEPPQGTIPVLSVLPEQSPELAAFCANQAYGTLMPTLPIGEGFFLDIPADEWYEDSAYQLARAGIMTGLKNADGVSLGLFDPSRNATQSEILRAILTARGVDIQEVVGENWYAPYFIEAERLGLEIGDGFDPAAPATRSQVTMLIGEAFCQTTTDEIPPLSFVDVDPSASWAGMFSILAQKLVVRGDNNAFLNARPEAPITRAELGTMILRAVRGLRQ